MASTLIDPAAAGAASDGRAETRTERADRNWEEVLQELRVMQTGTQILTGFILAVAFQPTFLDLSSGQRALYLALLVLAVLSAVIALAPVALHRALFRRHVKDEVVHYGHVCLIAALVTVGLLLSGVVAFVVDVVVGGWATWIAGGAFAAIVVTLWIIIPMRMRRRTARPEAGKTT